MHRPTFNAFLLPFHVICHPLPFPQLKPRSVQGVADAQKSAAASAKSSNPFGADKPREQVLAAKGVDAKLVDSRINKKAEVLHLTKVSCRVWRTLMWAV